MSNSKAIERECQLRRFLSHMSVNDIVKYILDKYTKDTGKTCGKTDIIRQSLINSIIDIENA